MRVCLHPFGWGAPRGRATPIRRSGQARPAAPMEPAWSRRRCGRGWGERAWSRRRCGGGEPISPGGGEPACSWVLRGYSCARLLEAGDARRAEQVEVPAQPGSTLSTLSTMSTPPAQPGSTLSIPSTMRGWVPARMWRKALVPASVRTRPCAHTHAHAQARRLCTPRTRPCTRGCPSSWTRRTSSGR